MQTRSSTEQIDNKVPIILDTDIGSDCDDTWALGLVMASSELNLLAVTTVGYRPDIRARIAKKLLLLGGHCLTPVHIGSATPLKNKKHQGPWERIWGGFPRFFNENYNLKIKRKELTWRKSQGHIDASNEITIHQQHAVDAIITLAKKHTNLEIIAIGPLTNIAQALQRCPEIEDKIRRITIMGGYLGQLAGFPSTKCGRSRMNVRQDYNLQIDSEAAVMVINSKIPKRLITPDVTLKAWLDRQDLARLSTLNSPFLRPAIKQNFLWRKMQRILLSTNENENLGYLHDPLTVASVIQNNLCTYQSLPLNAYLDRGLVRFSQKNSDNIIECATDVAVGEFKKFFIDRLLLHGVKQIAQITGLKLA